MASISRFFRIAAILLIASAFFHNYIHSDIEQRWLPMLFIMPVFKLQSTISDILFQVGYKDVHLPLRTLLTVGAFVERTRQFPNLSITEEYISEVPVQIYTPVSSGKSANKKPRRALIYYHGGGYTVNTPDNYHYLTGYISEQTHSVVFSVDYRKAPEHVHPAAIEDCFKVTKYILEYGAQEWNIDTTNVYIGGDSAGGHMTATVLLLLKRHNDPIIKNKDNQSNKPAAGHTTKTVNNLIPTPRGSILIYPSLQAISTNTPSFIENKDDFLLPLETVIKFRLNYYYGFVDPDIFASLRVNNLSTWALRSQYAKKFDLQELVHKGAPDVDQNGDPDTMKRYGYLYTDTINSPLFADDMDKAFPPSLIISCKFDVLRDDSVMLERRLRNMKIPVQHEMFNSFHGMISTAPFYGPAQRAIESIVKFMNK